MNTPVRAVAPVTSMQLQTDIGGLSIQPQNFGEVISFAEHMAKSTFVPAHLRGKPSDCLAVCLQALRWGMDPFSVGQKTYFTREGSPPGYEAQLIAAVVQSRAPLQKDLDVEWDGAWPNRTCTVTGYTRGNPKAKIRKVDARTITVRNSPLWKSDPDQQLAYYTIRSWARLYTPATIMGVYGRDEMAAEAVGADNAVDVTPVSPRPASNLDALEEIIGPNSWNKETGEIAESSVPSEASPSASTTAEGAEAPAVAEGPPQDADYDVAAVVEMLWQGALDQKTVPELDEYWKLQMADRKRLHEIAPEMAVKLAGEIKTRRAVLGGGGGK